MENLYEYSVDLIDFDGIVEESWDFMSLTRAKKKFDDLLETEMAGMHIQIWRRVPENNPVLLTGEEIL